MRATITCLADNASERPNGKLDIQGQYDCVYSRTEPITWPRMVYVARLEFTNTDPDAIPIELAILDEDEHPVAPSLQAEWKRQSFAPAGKPNVSALILEVRDALFPVFGTFQFVLFLDGKEHGRTYLHVEPMAEK